MSRRTRILLCLALAGCAQLPGDTPPAGESDARSAGALIPLSDACPDGRCGARTTCDGSASHTRPECTLVKPASDADASQNRALTGDTAPLAHPDTWLDPPTTDGAAPQEPPPAPGGGISPNIPALPDTCPTIKTGTVTVLGQEVQLWVGPKQPGKQGPLLFYWHGTGSTSAEARLLGDTLQKIQEEGGVVASFTTTTRTGKNTGNGVWYTGDFAMADALLACAVAQQGVDPRRIYTAGCSAGGLQASAMVYERSRYLAGAMPNSGGTVYSYRFQDPAHVPAVIAAHGSPERDVVIVNFPSITARFLADLARLGGFAVKCAHGGGHCASPPETVRAQWEFLNAHPFGVSPEPYADGLPKSFPSYCERVQ